MQEKNEQTAVGNCWEGIKETFTTSCHEILGVTKYHHKEWITNDTLTKVMEKKDMNAKVNSSRTRAEKTKAQKEHAEANKITKQSIKDVKRKYNDELAIEAEQAAKVGSMKGPYDTTKRLAGKRAKQERPVKEKKGQKKKKIKEGDGKSI